MSGAKWARRASIAYALGTWTMLGAVFASWKLGIFDELQEIRSTSTIDTEDELQKREKEKAIFVKERKERNVQLVNDVAELYTPIEFLA